MWVPQDRDTARPTQGNTPNVVPSEAAGMSVQNILCMYLKDCVAKKKSLFDSVESSEVDWNSHQTVIYSSVPTTGASAAGAGFSLTAVAAAGLAPTR